MKFPLLRGPIVQFDGFLLAFLIASLAGNVYLATARNRTVAASPERPRLIAAGSKAPAFKGQDLKGAPVSLAYNANTSGTLLYVFAPTCMWCERNQANLEAIAKARPDLRLVGVALSGDAQQLAAPSPFHQIIRPAPETIRAYGLGGTPATVLVSADGQIRHAWSGAYGEAIAPDISKALAVTLPGLLRGDPAK